MTDRQNRWAKTRRKVLLTMFGDRCENRKCGQPEELEFCHVKETDVVGRGRGRKERLQDISQHREAYVLLCDDCHKVLTGIERSNGGLLGSREATLDELSDLYNKRITRP